MHIGKQRTEDKERENNIFEYLFKLLRLLLIHYFDNNRGKMLTKDCERKDDDPLRREDGKKQYKFITCT